MECFTIIIDAAEEEEFKEAVLAYYFLLAKNRDLTRAQLDAAVESWSESKPTCQINFEVADALSKLERFELVSQKGDITRCKSLNDAKRQLDMIWDNHFTYHQANDRQKALEFGPTYT